MPPLFGGIFSDFIFKPILRPIIRFVCGLIAIPIFRLIMRKVCRVEAHDAEMERDLESWFRGALLLLVATANMESILFDWMPWWEKNDAGLGLALRLLLAVGVIESMPDEGLFSILHRGPPKLKLTTRAGWKDAWRQRKNVLRGIGVLHLRRSTPVFAIMTVILGPDLHRSESGQDYHVVGWWCYSLAIAQYLVIALITQRDKFEGLLEAFEREAHAIREDIAMSGAGSSAVVTDGEDEYDLNYSPGRRD